MKITSIRGQSPKKRIVSVQFVRYKGVSKSGQCLGRARRTDGRETIALVDCNSLVPGFGLNYIPDSERLDGILRRAMSIDVSVAQETSVQCTQLYE